MFATEAPTVGNDLEISLDLPRTLCIFRKCVIQQSFCNGCRGGGNIAIHAKVKGCLSFPHLKIAPGDRSLLALSSFDTGRVLMVVLYVVLLGSSPCSVISSSSASALFH